MQTANARESRPGASDDLSGARLPDSAQRQLDALRSVIDARLVELESALADPARGSELVGLIFELSRLATTEAQAAATRACFQIKHDGEAALLEAEARSSAAVEAERRISSELRKSLDKAQTRIELVEAEWQALLHTANEQTQLIESERHARVDLDRTIDQLEQQLIETRAGLDDAQESAQALATERDHIHEQAVGLEQRLADLERLFAAGQQSARALAVEHTAAGDRIAELELQLEAVEQRLTIAQHNARTASDGQSQEQRRAADLDRQLADARHRLEQAETAALGATDAQDRADRRASDLEGQLALAQQGLEEAHQTATADQNIRQTHEAESRAAADRIAALEAERRAGVDRIAALELELEEAQQQLIIESASARAIADARTHTEHRLAELEDALTAAQRELADATNEVVAQQRARDEAARLFADQQRALTEATRVIEVERAASADLRAAIASAHSTVDGEQQAMLTLRHAAAQAEARAAELHDAHLAAQAAHDAAARELEIERQRAEQLQGVHTDLLREQAELLREQADLQRVQAETRASLDAERAAAAELRGAATGSTEERTALIRELERATAAKSTLESALDEERERARGGQVADAELQRAVEQAHADVQAARADLAIVQKRLAAVESIRIGAEETAVESEARVAIVERERDALSLALDTERMMSSDLRESVAAAERQMTVTATLVEDLRQELEALRSAVQSSNGSDEDDATELLFDEDAAAESPDGAITLDNDGWEDLRIATRYSFASPVEIKVNGTPALLQDLSVAGCGVLTSTSLECSQSVRIHLPNQPAALLCVGEVVWVDSQPAAGMAPGGCRAGVQFTQVDEAAVEAFIIMRADL